MKFNLIHQLSAVGSVFALGTMSVIAQDGIDAHLAAARTAAADQHTAFFERLCPAPSPSPRRQQNAPAPARPRLPDPPDRALWHADPVRVFDNLFYVGQTEYSAWAVTTSDGIIIIDPLFDYSVEDEVVDGLTALGLDPRTIKYVLVSHGHRDHVGGARHLQERFGARVTLWRRTGTWSNAVQARGRSRNAIWWQPMDNRSSWVTQH